MTIRAVILDDEDLARRRMRAFLNRPHEVGGVSAFRDGGARWAPPQPYIDRSPGAPPPEPQQSYGAPSLPTGRALDRIAVKSAGRILILRVPEVDWIEAHQDYVSLHVGAKAHLIRETIADLQMRLAPAGFVRIHRSTLLNVDRVRELRPLTKGEFTVVLFDGTELKLSRNYRGALQAIAGFGWTDSSF